MRHGLVIGVDVGTGSAKAVVLDPDGGVLGRGSASYPMQTPRPSLAEQHPGHWWAGVVAAVCHATQDVRADRVAAIAVSGQGAAVVLLDAAGFPVRPALIHLDQRAGAEAEELASSDVGAAVAAANGNRVGAWNVAAKLTWMRRHEPESFSRGAAITSAAGFILARLTGSLLQSVSDAGISDLFCRSSRQWSAHVLTALDLPTDLLPDICESTDDLGPLTAAAATALGLSERVRVVAGGEDTSAAALAAGVLERGDAYLSLGTAGVVGVAVGPAAGPEPRLLTFPHVRRRLDLLSGSMTSAGSAVQWLAGLTGTDPRTLLAEAETVPAGAGGVLFLPYLAGELHPVSDPAARGIFAGLSLATNRAQLARAVVEASAAAIAHNLAVATNAGAAPTRLSAIGRPTGSAAWMQAVADATGIPVDVPADDGAPLGAAILAAAGSDADLPTLVAHHRDVHATYHPRPAEHTAATARRQATAALYQASRGRRP